jgi:hypothetical protein
VSDVPVAVAGIGGSTPPLSGVASVSSMGNNPTRFCATLISTRADCWGNFPGDGTTSYALAPVAVLGVGQTTSLSGVKTVVAETYGNADGSCALLITGGVDCWGYNMAGQLGDGTSTGAACSAECDPAPTAVVGVGGTGLLKSAVSLEAAGLTACVVVNSGEVNCWGWNPNGQLGDGTIIGPETCPNGYGPCSTSPVVVEGVAGGTSKLSLS